MIVNRKRTSQIFWCLELCEASQQLAEDSRGRWKTSLRVRDGVGEGGGGPVEGSSCRHICFFQSAQKGEGFVVTGVWEWRGI